MIGAVKRVGWDAGWWFNWPMAVWAGLARLCGLVWPGGWFECAGWPGCVVGGGGTGPGGQVW
jgi:hypothetical protein